MRILLVNRFFGDEQAAHSGRLLHDVALHLVAKGHTVEVLSSRDSYITSAPAKVGGAGGFVMHFAFTLPFRLRPLNWFLFWCQALILVPLLNWDRCVVLTDPPFLILSACTSRLFRRRKKRPLILWAMDLYPEALAAASLLNEGGLAYRCLRRINNLGLKNISGVISLGERQKQRLSRYPALHNRDQAILVIPPWDARPLQPHKTSNNGFLERHGLKDAKIALYSGNLGQGHSSKSLVAAARSLPEANRNDWRFVFVTHGAGRKQLIEDTTGLKNFRVIDHLPLEEFTHLLFSATVHLITMKLGWEGIIIPSKLYGILQTEAPVLFLGPPEADTIKEIHRFNAGLSLPADASELEILEALDELAQPKWKRHRIAPIDYSLKVADFVLRPW